MKQHNSHSAGLLPGLLPGLALLLTSEAGSTEPAASGITFNAGYIGEVASNLSGGIQTGSDLPGQS